MVKMVPGGLQRKATIFGAHVSRRIASFCGFVVLLYLLAVPNACAVVFDGGVDPANLGKGEWIYVMSQATNKLNGNVTSVTNVPSLMWFVRGWLQCQYVVVKAGDNGGLYPNASNPQFTTNLVQAAHAQKLKIFGYTRCYGTSVSPIVGLASNVFNCGADGFILDAEDEWVTALGSTAASNAWWLCGTIKSNWPTKFLAHSPICNISGHSSFPYKEFGYWCDAVMPQVYWVQWGKADRGWQDPLTGQYYYQVCTPIAAVGLMNAEWRSFQDQLRYLGNTPLGTSWTNAIKPLVPIGQANTPGSLDWTGKPNQTWADMTNFVNCLKTNKYPVTVGGYKGCCFFALGEPSPYDQDWPMMGGIGASRIGDRGLEFFEEPISQTAIPGSTITFWSTANGPGPFGFRWYKNGSPLTDGPGIASSGSSNLVLSAILAAQAGDYYVVVTNSSCAVTSAVATLTVLDPYINTQPTNPTAAMGSTVSISLGASGTPPLSYQWLKEDTNLIDGGNVIGATTSNLTLSDLGRGDVAGYSVIVQNGLGASVTSTVVNLTVTGLPTPPGITTQPASQSAAIGSNVTFTVAIEGSVPMSYQWRWNGEDLPGATDSSLTLTNITSPQAGSYSVFVTNAYGTTTSADAILGIGYALWLNATGYGKVTKAPDLAVYPPGTVVTLTAIPNDGNALLNWSGDLSGNATSAEITLDKNKSVVACFGADVIVIDNRDAGFGASTGWHAVTNSTDTHQYGPDHWYCLATSALGALARFSPTITTPGFYDVYIWYQEGSDRSSCVRWDVFYDGGIATTEVNQKINGGQWVQIASAKHFAAGTTGWIRVTSGTPDWADSPRPRVIADAVKLVFSVMQTAPSIVIQPQAAAVNAGNTLTLNVGASGDRLSYQWFKNDMPLSDDSNVVGSATTNLTLSNITLADCASYRVVVTNVLGAVTSQWATVSLVPSILIQPANVTVVADGKATFSVAVTGSAPLIYRWQKDGSPLSDSTTISSATSSTLTLNRVSALDAGLYSVVVTNTAGTAVSSNAVLVVIPRPQLGISFLRNSQFGLSLTGEPGGIYVLETSTNLLDWISATNLIATNGACEFLDSTSDPRRFYRAVKQP